MNLSHDTDPAVLKQWATQLSVSMTAVQLLRDHDVVDLHVDSFIWSRLFGYDIRKRHGRGPLAARYCFQSDLPRLRDASVDGAVWVITTNPFRTARGRLRALENNLDRLTALLESPDGNAAVVTSHAEYLAARASGKHAAFLAVQGGNALSALSRQSSLPLSKLLRVTLVHLTNSDIGRTSSPLGLRRDKGLRPRGFDLVAMLEEQRVLVDLAHAHPKTFWDAVHAHDRSKPLLVSHTGFSSVTPHWRNIDDTQAKAIADSGGVIGVLYHGPFLGDAPWGGRVRSIARHLAHGIHVVGAKHVCLGSDWDGMIATPLDMPTCLELPRLVQALLDLKVSEEDIAQVLGRSFLELIERYRP